MPPSSACSQLHSSITLETWRWVSGTCVQANFGSGGIFRPAPDRPRRCRRVRRSDRRSMRTLCLNCVFLRLVQHVDAVAVDVELPAVIDAAQPAFLVAPEEQRGAAMRAVFVDQTDAALAVAERHEVLAEQPDAHRRTIRLRRSRATAAPESNSARIASPIGVPGPTRVISSLSSCDSMGVLLLWIVESLDPGRSGDNAAVATAFRSFWRSAPAGRGRVADRHTEPPDRQTSCKGNSCEIAEWPVKSTSDAPYQEGTRDSPGCVSEIDHRRHNASPPACTIIAVEDPMLALEWRRLVLLGDTCVTD